jgi:uncharacterized membrane protein YcaP (DUF421 family)
VDIVFRAAVGFCFLVVLTRLIGRRELSSMEPFDLILLIVLGDLIQQGVTQSDYSLTGLVLTGGTFAVLAVGLSFAVYKFPRLRPVLEDEPLIVVQDGTVVEKNLKRERITAEEVAAEARMQQIASLEDVEWAVLETSGRISFIPKKR